MAKNRSTDNPVMRDRAGEDRQFVMQVTARDRYSSFLVAGIVVAGILAAILILLFYLNIDPIRNPWQQIHVLKPLELYQMTLAKNEEEFEEPELSQSSQGFDLNEYSDAVSEAISNTPALAGLASDPGEGIGEVGNEPRKRRTHATRDRRPDERLLRWALTFSIASEKEYLEQIDSLGIELGLLDKKSSRIDYAKNVSRKTKLRDDVRKNEKRFYFSSRSDKLDRWNRDVFKKSGLKTDDKLCLRFFPADTISQMTKLEQEYCKREKLHPAKDLRQTRFGLTKTSKGWEIVLEKVLTH